VRQAPAPALGGHQALGKGPVGFAVLGGDGAQRARLGHVKLEVGLRVGLEHGADDVLRGLVLEDAGVAALLEPVPRGQHQGMKLGARLWAHARP